MLRWWQVQCRERVHAQIQLLQRPQQVPLLGHPTQDTSQFAGLVFYDGPEQFVSPISIMQLVEGITTEKTQHQNKVSAKTS